MDKTTEEIEAIYAEFKALGEDKVRLYLATNKFGEASGKKALAPIWLEQEGQHKLINTKAPWRKTLLGIIAIGVFIGLCVAYLSYRFGWLSAPTQ